MRPPTGGGPHGAGGCRRRCPYAGLWVYERALLSETLLLPAIAVMILLIYRFHDRPSLGGVAVLGGMCGVLAITRSEQILIFPLVVLPLVLGANRDNWRRALGWTGTALVVRPVVVMPWTIFNLGRFQRPVLLSNGFGPALAQSIATSATMDRRRAMAICVACTSKSKVISPLRIVRTHASP